MPTPSNDTPPDLLVAGASARAAAFSAIRAGLSVAAADLFADCDLAGNTDATRIVDWPAGIEIWAAGFPSRVPLIYTGGLENEPELLDRIAANRPLLGIRGEPLRQVRTSEQLQQILQNAGVPVANCGYSSSKSTKRWLFKPRRSAAGRGVRFWNGELVGPETYLQEFVEGTPGSAAFLATRGSVEFLGATDLLLPDSAPLSVETPFAYVGSVTSNGVSAASFEQLGSCLAGAGLTGLFGVDFVRPCRAEPTSFVVIEVNPRYTAGMEVLELRSGRSFVAEHLAAFAPGMINDGTPVASSEQQQCIGKRIVYAPETIEVGPLPVPTFDQIMTGRHEFADVPKAGSIISAGAPICTIFAKADSPRACVRSLRQRELALLREM